PSISGTNIKRRLILGELCSKSTYFISYSNCYATTNLLEASSSTCGTPRPSVDKQMADIHALIDAQLKYFQNNGHYMKYSLLKMPFVVDGET
ncbi:hypothetical protein L9F63_025098, partial [Diploptera punctata]